jgi:hypothetical protein
LKRDNQIGTLFKTNTTTLMQDSCKELKTTHTHKSTTMTLELVEEGAFLLHVLWPVNIDDDDDDDEEEEELLG